MRSHEPKATKAKSEDNRGDRMTKFLDPGRHHKLLKMLPLSVPGTRRSMAASVVTESLKCFLLADGAAGSSQEHDVVEVVKMSASAGSPSQWLLTSLVGCCWLSGFCKSTRAAQIIAHRLSGVCWTNREEINPREPGLEDVITERSDAADYGMLCLEQVKNENAASAAECERGSEEHQIWTNDPDMHQGSIVTRVRGATSTRDGRSSRSAMFKIHYDRCCFRAWDAWTGRS